MNKNSSPSSSNTSILASSDQSQYVQKNKFLEDYSKFYKNISPNEKNTTIMGKYNEYSSADFLDFGDDNVDIFIQNNQIFVICAPKKIHECTSDAMRYAIRKALEQIRTNEYHFIGFGSADVEVFNFKNCCSVFNKQPDFSFDILPSGNRKYPSIVGEVAKPNENFKMLLDEIDCYLNEYTHIQYVIGIIFFGNSFNMRLIVAERRAYQMFFKDEYEKSSFPEEKRQLKDPECTVNDNRKRASKLDLNSNDLMKMRSDEIERYYNFNINVDEIRKQETTNSPIRFQLRTAPLFTGTTFASSIEFITISLEEEDLIAISNIYNS